MKKIKLISKIFVVIAIICALFLPFISYYRENNTGIDLLVNTNIYVLVKFFFIASILCGILVFFQRKNIHIAVTSCINIGILLTLFFVTSIFLGIEFKIGVYIELSIYTIIAFINFLVISVSKQTESDKDFSKYLVNNLENKKSTNSFDLKKWVIKQKRKIVVFACILGLLLGCLLIFKYIIKKPGDEFIGKWYYDYDINGQGYEYTLIISRPLWSFSVYLHNNKIGNADYEDRELVLKNGDYISYKLGGPWAKKDNKTYYHEYIYYDGHTYEKEKPSGTFQGIP